MEYLAPEMINKCGHDQQVDVWELGVLCYELIFAKSPFSSDNEDINKFAAETYSNILYNEVLFEVNGSGSLTSDQ